MIDPATNLIDRPRTAAAGVDEPGPESVGGKDQELARRIRKFDLDYNNIETQVQKAVVGMEAEVQLVIASIFTGGNVLMEGRPGLAKTLLAKSVADALGLKFSRIQFTPDTMPGDITGSVVLDKSREFVFKPGPIFANVILADEINRSGPKTQAALLEAMQEGQVTINGVTYQLPKPFIVLATQNPKESAGTYPLPDAQRDRFAVMVKFNMPGLEDLVEIMGLTTANSQVKVESVFADFDTASRDILSARELVRDVTISNELLRYIGKLVCTLNPGHPDGVKVDEILKSIDYGPSPRAGQAILLLAKVTALQSGRAFVSKSDIDAAVLPTLGHRVIPKIEELDAEVNVEGLLQKAIEAVSNATKK